MQADVDHTTTATWSCFECSPSEPIPSGLLQWLHVAFTPAATLLLVDVDKNEPDKVIFCWLPPRCVLPMLQKLCLYHQRGVFGARALRQVPVPAGSSTREVVANAVYNLQSLQLQSWRLPPSVRLLRG